MQNKPVSALAAGLVIGLTSIILFMAYYFTGLVFQRDWMAWIPAIIFIGLVIVFISMWSNAQNNYVTFGSCFGFGFKAISIATLIIFLFTALFINLVPDYKVQMLQMMKEQLRQNKQATDDAVEKGMDMVSGNFTIITLGGSVFANVVMGTIGSLLGAAITKKKPFDPFTQINQTGDTQA